MSASASPTHTSGPSSSSPVASWIAFTWPHMVAKVCTATWPLPGGNPNTPPLDS
ncbi:hypothetical protein [Nannocystis pusilla]|uniref:hypothetical protein n=1 Tax=Nannocystis pusilla TaxID=889268 RepID=UPI003B80070E